MKMKATVLPRKQLEYMLKKGGFVEDGFGNWYGSSGGFFYKEMFLYCDKEIDLVRIWASCYDLSDLTKICNNWKKKWFIPNSFKED